jgi:hypothetical protein
MGTLNQLLLHVKSFPCLRSRPVRPSDCRLTNSGVLDTVVGRAADSAHGTANRQASGLYPTFSSTTCEPCQQTDGARSIDGVQRGSIAASLRKIILATFRFFAFSHKLGHSRAGPTSSRPANVCYVSDRYRNYEPLKATRRTNSGQSAPQRKGAITSLTSQRRTCAPNRAWHGRSGRDRDPLR